MPEGNWWIMPAVLISLAAFVALFIRSIVKCYKTVAPNQVAVVSGWGGKKFITGGGVFVWPIVQKVQYLLLNVMTIPVEVINVPDSNGALVSVRGVANVKILSDMEHLPRAAERFLGKSEQEIIYTAKENLEGNLRAIVGKLRVEELISDRASFQQNVLNEAAGDMKKLGLEVDLLNIQDIRDERGYIESLGKRRTAEVVRDATIGEAEARRDADIKSAQARQAGEIAKAQAQQEISNAERERDEIVARNAALVQAEQARIAIAAETAAADERKRLNVAQVAAEQARVTAEIDLQEAIRRRTVAELNATQIEKANKDAEAAVITAQGQQDAAVRLGEAERIKEEKRGQGAQARMSAEAIGRKASAEALQAEKEAEAAGKKAILLAEADGIKAKLIAEADGTLKKAEAYAQLDEAGRLLMILEALPPILEALGVHVVAPAAKAIGDGLGNVKEIRLVDLGGGSGNGNILTQFANTPVEVLFGISQKLEASGMMPAFKALLSKAGINLDPVLAGMKEVSTSGTPDKPTDQAKVGSETEE